MVQADPARGRAAAAAPGGGNGTGALHTARRIAKILKTIVGQLDVLETMTPRQFAAFRPAARLVQRLPVQPVPRDRGGARPARLRPEPTPTRAWPPRWTAARCSTRCCATWHVAGCAVPARRARARPARAVAAATRRCWPCSRAVYADEQRPGGRGVRGAGRHRRGHPGMALPAREDGRADHRRPDRAPAVRPAPTTCARPCSGRRSPTCGTVRGV